jgi:glycosyltransferase involved in cell wall biosynthesis
MRIALFSNLYPPLCLGGYEIGAARVVGELRRRGHEVLVLTAHEYHVERAGRWRCHRHAGSARAALVDAGPCVLGSLARLGWRAPLRLLRLLGSARRARRACRAALTAFRPELVLLFNPLGVLAPVLTDCVRLARRWCAPVRTYVSDPWLAEWPNAQPLLRFWSRLGLWSAGRPRADRDRVCSRHVQHQSGGGGQVVPWGLPGTAALTPLPEEHFRGPAPQTFLFAGQVQPHKGLDLLLRALARCRRPHRLVVLGEDDTDHADACKQLAADLGIRERVLFAGKQPADWVPALLPRLGQVLVVPSVWEEPFSLVVLEGMAAGLAVVAADTGGTAEALTDQQTGFLFRARDSQALTGLLDRLEEERALCHRVGTRAQEEVRRRFSIETMVDQLLLGCGEESRHARAPKEGIACVSS